MIKEAIILAGGLGTRLRGVIDDIPKPMAPISNTPFIQYLFEYLIKQGITHAVLAVGYKSECITEYFGDSYKTIKISYAFEKEPLGTGGGIANALDLVNAQECFLINGDTYFNVKLHDLYELHSTNNSDLTLSLKAMTNFDRYGTVEIDRNNRITQFCEKTALLKGLINGGVYVISKYLFGEFNKGEKFSFEKDIMEVGLEKFKIYGYNSESYFIDIGIPEDFEKAILELPTMFGF